MKKIAESTVAVHTHTHTHTHTSNLKNKENKIVKRDICENASNCGVNKYNIKTFEKTKSNHVGVGVPDDPQIKQKHTNKPMSNILTSNTAITLVALVITIIVLLILAGVTLNMVIGENGIFGKANIASENTKIANAKEIIRLAVLENEVYKNTNDSRAKSDSDLQTEVETKLTNEGYKVEEGKITIGKAEPIEIAEEIKKLSTGGNGDTQGGETAGKEDKSKNRTLAGTTEGYSYKNPVIPQGFKAVNVGNAEWSYKDSKKDEVKGWNEGLVIEDEIGNQFVWIPVDGSSVPYAKWCTVSIYYSSCSDDTSAIPVTENTQIDTYHGFYVARYEAGLTTTTTSQSASTNNNTNTTAVSKEGSKIWNYIDYNKANTVAQTMINNQAIYGENKSGLVTGTQWDTIMKWYENAGIKVDITQDWGTYVNLPYTIPGTTEKPALWFNADLITSTWSNSTSNVEHTEGNGKYFHASGLNKDGIKKNIADLGGNVCEWTAEIDNSYPVLRSGAAYGYNTSLPASGRGIGDRCKLRNRVPCRALCAVARTTDTVGYKKEKAFEK